MRRRAEARARAGGPPGTRRTWLAPRFALSPPLLCTHARTQHHHRRHHSARRRQSRVAARRPTPFGERGRPHARACTARVRARLCQAASPSAIFKWPAARNPLDFCGSRDPGSLAQSESPSRCSYTRRLECEARTGVTAQWGLCGPDSPGQWQYTAGGALPVRHWHTGTATIDDLPEGNKCSSIIKQLSSVNIYVV